MNERNGKPPFPRLDPGELLDESDKIIQMQKKRSFVLRRIVYAVLATASILLHTAIIASAYSSLREKGGEFLFSFIVPEYEISAPQVPKLPKGSTVEKEEEKKEESPTDVTKKDLSSKAQNGLSLSNETAYNPDLLLLLEKDKPTMSAAEIRKKYGEDAPSVLIYHTHATEGYSDTRGTGFRTADPESNTVYIGKVITSELTKAGIGVIHLTEQFDRNDWSRAYDNSNSAVRKTLSDNPSIQYVFDVHRDCIGNEETGYVSPLTKINEKETAQLMFVCGTDEGGSGHTAWRQNLTGAVKLQALIHKDFPTLMRPINLRRASFYQDTSPASLILECGSCANTKEEAKRAAVIFARALAEYITE